MPLLGHIGGRRADRFGRIVTLGATMSIIGTIVVGFIIGLLARALKPGDDRMGIIMTTLLGIAGALVAKYVGQSMGWYGPTDAAGWIASVIGAIVLLVVFGLVRSPRRL